MIALRRQLDGRGLRILRFGLVGVAATALYVALAHLFLAVGASVELAHVAATGLSLVFSYLAQKAVTFRVSGDHRRYGPRFAIATAGLVTVSSAAVAALSAAGFADGAVVIGNAVVYPAASFLVHTFWTFAAAQAD